MRKLALLLVYCLWLASSARAQTPLGCGETLQNREINPASEVDTYTFTAQAGERVALTAWANAGVALQPVAVLLGPTGAVALNGSLVGCTGTCTSATLPATGNYSVQVTDSGQNQTGLYHITLEPISRTFNGAANGGANPTCQRGSDGTQPLACGVTIGRTVDVIGESDSFSFDAAAGEVVAITTWPVGAAPNTVVQLFGPTGVQVLLRGSTGFCNGNCVSAVLPSSGTYTIVLWDSGLDQTGAYSITLEPLSATFNGASNGPPTPACRRGGDGTQVLSCGLDQAFQIDAIGESDSFVFEARAGEALAITAWILAGSTVNPAVWLYGPGGAQVPINGGFGLCTSGICLTGPLPSNGVYTLVFWDFGLNDTGTYQLTLESISGTFNGASNAAPSPVCQRGTEGTQAITCGETLSRGIASIADSDSFTFHARAGEAVYITVGGSAPGPLLNPTLLLFGPGGARIPVNGSIDYCANGLCATAALPGDGPYTFVVWDHGLNQNGAYDVTLESISGSFGGVSNAPPAPTCRRGADGTQPAAIGSTAAVASFSAPAESDSFTFQGTAGQSLIIARWSTAAPAIDPQLKLYGPGGGQVSLNGTLNFCGTTLCVPPALPSTGTYTVMAWEGNLNQTGSFRLGVFADDGDGIAPLQDRCPFFAQTNATLDTDGDARGDECECGDANADARNNVADIVAVNSRIFDPAPAVPLCGPGVPNPCHLCDSNDDNVCNVADIVAVNSELFSPGSTSTCARQRAAGPP